MSNLSTLNTALFDTLSQLQKGDISIEKANAITQVSTQIINSAKVQITAFKLTKGTTAIPAFAKNTDFKAKLSQGDNYEKKRAYAIDVLKYDTLAAAIQDLGAYTFKTQFNKYINN